jgi:hypothetical protein
VASCGIAALLLEGGRIQHSRFHIPLNNTDESICEIKHGSYLAGLIKRTSLIFLDEAPMVHRNCFEALDKSLRDILRSTNEESENKPFDGMTVILGGDFLTNPTGSAKEEERTYSECINKVFISM